MLLLKPNKKIFVNKDILLLLLLFFGTIIVLLLLNKGDNKDILDLLIETPVIAIFTSTIVVKLLHGDNSNEKDIVVHFYPESAKLTIKESHVIINYFYNSIMLLQKMFFHKKNNSNPLVYSFCINDFNCGTIKNSILTIEYRVDYFDNDLSQFACFKILDNLGINHILYLKIRLFDNYDGIIEHMVASEKLKNMKETYVFANIIHYYLMNNQYKGAVKYSNTSFEYQVINNLGQITIRNES